MKQISIRTSSQTELIDITPQIQQYLTDTQIKEGIIILYVPHTTAGITINEGADPAVQHDIITFLNKLIPPHSGYEHSEGNSDAHIKASIIGSSETLLIHNSELVLGTWQRIFFFEADGPRTRHIHITHIP